MRSKGRKLGCGIVSDQALSRNSCVAFASSLTPKRSPVGGRLRSVNLSGSQSRGRAGIAGTSRSG